MALFAVPIVASTLTYRYFRPEASANYGELLTPPVPVTEAAFHRPTGEAFRFSQLRGKWLLVASDSGACPDSCAAKLTTMRQVRLALGRNAMRVERVFVADDTRAVDAGALAPFAGMLVVTPEAGTQLPLSAANDRAHFYVIDPLGNVMMRYPANADAGRMLKDLDRLLRASQIG
jgi:cytochrome oxidase Cu insertion factor (SCO1/SenC/PrrC family)